jgi:hypothetical protein
MRRIITKELAVKIRAKLCGNETPKTTGGHDVYAVRYDGQVVGQVSVRRGSEKDKGHDHIPHALNISPNFAKEIGICNKDLHDYLNCLRDKNLLPKVSPESPDAPPTKQPERPWERDWAALPEPPEPDPSDGESGT